MTALDDGLAAIEKGWSAFLVGGSKVPFAKSHGHLEATNDPEKFRAMHEQRTGQRRKAAIALGPGEIVLDVDYRHNGHESALGLATAPDVVKPGGPHFYFRADGLRGRGAVLPGIDLKTDGGYVVVYDAQKLPRRDSLRPMPEALRTRLLGALDASGGVSAVEENLAKESIPDGEVNDTLKDHAWSLAQHYEADEIVAMLKVIQASRADKRLPDAELRRMAEGAARKRERHEVIPLPTIVGKAKTPSRVKPPSLVTVSAADLLANPPPKPMEIIPGLLPAGLSLLASAPKVGKSWLAYQEAVAVATGGEVLGRQAVPGDVLYLALEDGKRRAYERVTKILGRSKRTKLPVGRTLDLAFNSGKGTDAIEQVEEWLALHPAARLVLIDTLQKVRSMASSGQPQYAVDVDDVGRILGIAQRHPDVAVQVVHHDNKASRAPGADFVDAVSGTSGISGSVDAVLVLRRKRHDATGTLEVTGKDIREDLLHLSYDTDDPFWAIDPLGGITAEQREAYDWIEANGAAGAKAVSDGLARERTSTQRLLDRLAESGVLKKTNGKFDLPLRISFNNNSTHSTDDNNSTDSTHGTRRKSA